jgi:hypothetical protein
VGGKTGRRHNSLHTSNYGTGSNTGSWQLSTSVCQRGIALFPTDLLVIRSKRPHRNIFCLYVHAGMRGLHSPLVDTSQHDISVLLINLQGTIAGHEYICSTTDFRREQNHSFQVYSVITSLLDAVRIWIHCRWKSTIGDTNYHRLDDFVLKDIGAVWTRKQISTFRRNILSPSSWLK